jgi:hypothetical protein
MRIGNGLGVGFGGRASVAPFAPASLSGCVLGHVYDASASMFTTDVGAVASANTDPVGRVVALAGPNGLQSSSGLRPTRQSDGLQFDVADDTLDFTALSLTGDFTVYVAFTQGDSSTSVPLGSGANSAIAFIAGSIYLCLADGTTPGWVWTIGTGRKLARFRRSGSSISFAGSGVGETSLTNSATFAPSNVGARVGAGQRMASTLHRSMAVFAYSRDLTAGERTQMEAWFGTLGAGYAL